MMSAGIDAKAMRCERSAGSAYLRPRVLRRGRVKTETWGGGDQTFEGGVIAYGASITVGIGAAETATEESTTGVTAAE